MKKFYVSAFPVIALTCLATYHRFGFIRRRLHLKLLPPLFFILCLLYSLAAFSYETGVKLIGSDTNGVTLEVEVGNLAIESREFDNRIYHVIGYKDCGFTGEVGKPKLPVSRVFIGIPPSATLSVATVNSKFLDLLGYVPIPVPDKVLQTSSDGIDSINEKFTIDKDFYSQKVFYPQSNANVVYHGYIRHQRVASIELHPVQYNPASKILRKYTKLTVRVSFLSKGENIPGQAISPSEFNVTSRSDRDFEKLYKSLILNYEEAKPWRARVPDLSFAPKAPNSESESYKIFVSKSGIYKLDYETLKNIGINLSKVDPRTFKLRFRDKQVPIYVRGEADGKFDKDDYIEFFSPEVKNIYTRWDVYWLTYNGAKGLRMVEKSGISKSRTVREITSFKSVVRLEEDHLHQKLQNVQPDPNNLEAWFESRDHWFWTGIENGSAKNEVTVKFPVYDMAQSLARPNFKIELVGCTNFEHNVMISVNGYRIGQEANWSRQDIYSYDGTMPANSLIEGINELRLTRIGTNPGDGENTDSYPYQIYLNWFEFAYIRKLMAVNDSLDFTSPESKEPGSKEINRYSIGGFAKNDVEIFQIEGSNAISKFRDLTIDEYKLDSEELDRARMISSINNQDVPIFDRPKIKDTAYKAIFEDQGGRSYRYIAVSSSSILKPDRIELDTKSNLKDPSNQADYIIISHPIFMDAAKELANWRSGQNGGSFRTKVIDATDIYDEFNSGMVSPKAIKDFLKYAYHNWAEPTISYVLIFGDATYDFLGINEEVYKEPPELTGFIPTFYSWTTYGQTAVDHWYSTINGNDGFPDIYLGRIPVENIEQAKAVLNKITANESGKYNGPWRKRIISIADDDSHAAGDEIFRIGLEEIWQNHTPPGYDTEKIYLKDIIQEQESNPENFKRPGDVAEERIKEAFAKEAIIAQYAGHGGRHVWAHEIIFSITDIEELKETNIYPLLLVLSCYNGFFDLPGEISMSEGMLRADKRGIVAMISATRLTYGTGNVALNNSLFDGIFKDKIYKIGHLLAKAKIEVLLNEGMSWLSQMEEYTLFGDPASWLNMPDYEIKPQLDNASVSVGGKLELKSGQVLTTLDGKPASFDGEFVGVVELLDGKQLSKKIASITKGIYPAMSFDIPGNIKESEGVLKLYGENTKETAVGGVRFGINVPFISNVTYEIIGNGIQFYVELSHNAGLSGIKSAKVTWFNSSKREWEDTSMVFDSQKKLYKFPQPVSISSQNDVFIYYINVEDINGKIVNTDQKSIKLPTKANLTISKYQNSSETIIYYTYSNELGKWGLNVEITNTGTEKIQNSFEVVVFSNDPDQDNNKVVDSNAKIMGRSKLDPKDWSENRTASVFVPVTLNTGRYSLFVWLDPEFNLNHKENTFGVLDEGSETDNLFQKILDIKHILLAPGQENSTKSLDSVIQFKGQSGTVNKNEVLTVDYLQKVQNPVNQPGASFIELPEGKQTGYRISSISNDEILKFNRKANLQIEYNLAPLKEEIKKELGLPAVPDDQMSQEQRDSLDQALKEKISKLSIYKWQDEVKKWARIMSKPVLNENGNILTNIHSTMPSRESNNNINPISPINIEKAKPPIDEWSIVFIDYQHFRVEGAKTGILKNGSEIYIGTIGQEFYHQATGFKFTIFQGIMSFNAGDRFKFATLETGIIEADIESTGIFTLMWNNDERTPDIQITVGSQSFNDGDVVSPEPGVQIFIYDENGVDVLNHPLEIGISKKTGDTITAKEDDYAVNWDPNSNQVSATYWPGVLEPGEYFVKVKAYDFNGNPSNKTIKFLVKKEFEIEKNSLMNYPNPFEHETDITFKLTSLADEAIIKIYTVSGRLIRTINEKHLVNFVKIHWDSRDEDGKEVANGVYYYKVTLKRSGKKDIVEIGKMMKLK